MAKHNWKKLLNLVPIIGIIIFIYLIIDIGVDKIIDAFIRIPIQYYALASLLLIPRILISTYKWWEICQKQKMNYAYSYLFKIFLISTFYGNITPGGLGWHIRIFYLKKKKKVSIEKCLTNSIIDVTLGFIAGLLLALIGSIIIINKQPGFFPIILIFLIINVTTFIVLMQKRGGSKLFKYLIRPLIPKKYKSKVDESVESLYEDIPRLRDVIKPLLADIIVFFLASTQVFILAQAFDINIPYLDFILLSIISVVFVGILPISVGGLGVREGVFAFLLFNLYGVPLGIGFALSLAGYLVKMIIPASIGLSLSLKKEYKLS